MERSNEVMARQQWSLELRPWKIAARSRPALAVSSALPPPRSPFVLPPSIPSRDKMHSPENAAAFKAQLFASLL
jgi:hypothetical protein